MMIKVLAPAVKHPQNRTLDEFRRYWAVSHGPLFANTRKLRRYVQHLTLPEASGIMAGGVTYDGCSMFWYDDLEVLRHPSQDAVDVALWDAVMADDRQLFDRTGDWPISDKTASIVAQEHVVADGRPRRTW